MCQPKFQLYDAILILHYTLYIIRVWLQFYWRFVVENYKLQKYKKFILGLIFFGYIRIVSLNNVFDSEKIVRSYMQTSFSE